MSPERNLIWRLGADHFETEPPRIESIGPYLRRVSKRGADDDGTEAIFSAALLHDQVHGRLRVDVVLMNEIERAILSCGLVPDQTHGRG